MTEGIVDGAASFLSHSLILKGASQASMGEALRLATRANCLNLANDNVPCGHCVRCRQINEGTFPYWFQLSPTGSSNTIPVDAIRALLQDLAISAGVGLCKVAVFVDAHRLSTESQGFLLKALEEPPSGTMFLLLTEKPEELLATVRSRCQVFAIREEEETVDQFELALAEEVIWAIETQGYPAVFSKASFVDGSRKKNLSGFIRALEQLMRDRLIACLGSPLSTAQKQITGEGYLEALNQVWLAAYLIERNVNTRLILEVLFLKLMPILIEIKNPSERGCSIDGGSGGTI